MTLLYQLGMYVSPEKHATLLKLFPQKPISLTLNLNFQITSIINDAIQSPDNTNELKKLQMRELALLNGTLRDEDMLKCRNCGALVSVEITCMLLLCWYVCWYVLLCVRGRGCYYQVISGDVVSLSDVESVAFTALLYLSLSN